MSETEPRLADGLPKPEFQPELDLEAHLPVRVQPALVRVRQGDVLVLTYDGVSTSEQRANISDHLADFFFKRGIPNIGCMVLDAGISIDSVVRKEAEENSTGE